MSSLKARRSSRTKAVGLPGAAPAGWPAAVIGRIAGFDEAGAPLVDFPGRPGDGPLPALATVAIGRDAADAEAALLFVEGDPRRPLIVGLLRQPEPAAETSIGGERVLLTAGREIVLQCGKASITLTRAGKVLIRGAYLLSRSSGVNRIKGGSVQVN